MGEVLSLNPLGWPERLALGPTVEMEHVGTIDGVRVSIASQADAHPGWVHVVVSDAKTAGATSVAVAHDTDEGHRLGRFVARAVLRALHAVQHVPISSTKNAYPPEETSHVGT